MTTMSMIVTSSALHYDEYDEPLTPEGSGAESKEQASYQEK